MGSCVFFLRPSTHQLTSDITSDLLDPNCTRSVRTYSMSALPPSDCRAPRRVPVRVQLLQKKLLDGVPLDRNSDLDGRRLCLVRARKPLDAPDFVVELVDVKREVGETDLVCAALHVEAFHRGVSHSNQQRWVQQHAGDFVENADAIDTRAGYSLADVEQPEEGVRSLSRLGRIASGLPQDGLEGESGSVALVAEELEGVPALVLRHGRQHHVDAYGRHPGCVEDRAVVDVFLVRELVPVAGVLRASIISFPFHW